MLSFTVRFHGSSSASIPAHRHGQLGKVRNTQDFRQAVCRALPGTRPKARARRFVWNTTLDQHEQLCAIAGMCCAKPPGVSFFTLGKHHPNSQSGIIHWCSITFGLNLGSDAHFRTCSGQLTRVPSVKQEQDAAAFLFLRQVQVTLVCFDRQLHGQCSTAILILQDP